MSRMSRHFDEQDLRRVNAAIAEVEANTSAEIICVATASSGRYDRAEDLFGLLVGMLAAATVWLLLPDAVPGGDSWAGFTPAAKITFMAVAVVAGFIGGTILASHAWPLRRPFIPRAQQTANVMRAASAAFFDQSLHQTSAGTGLLIYVSFDERRAVILGDAAVLDVLPQAQLDTLCRDLTTLLADTDPAEALCQTIRRAGESLADLSPDADIEPDTKLPNELVLVG
ncbi:MAG: hypothetical protein AAF911_00225 [Planctomycetota bacterium]